MTRSAPLNARYSETVHELGVLVAKEPYSVMRTKGLGTVLSALLHHHRHPLEYNRTIHHRE